MTLTVSRDRAGLQLRFNSDSGDDTDGWMDAGASAVMSG